MAAVFISIVGLPVFATACDRSLSAKAPAQPVSSASPHASPEGTPPPDADTDTELNAPQNATPPTVDAGAAWHAALPDPALTPGDVFPVGTEQICVSGYSSRVRNVSTATKSQAYAEYHIVTHTTGQYEVDHLIPLELGGSNDLKNLWPEPAEPRPGFHEKDLLENKLHDLVCAGSLDLTTAQRAIASNWYAAYVQYDLNGVPANVPPPPASTVVPSQAPAATPGVTGSVALISVIGASPGGVASASAQTSPAAVCSIVYVTPAGTTSKAQGLATNVADAAGVASWTWNIGSSTRPGVGSVTVTCGGASVSEPITIG